MINVSSFAVTIQKIISRSANTGRVTLNFLHSERYFFSRQLGNLLKAALPNDTNSHVSNTNNIEQPKKKYCQMFAGNAVDVRAAASTAAPYHSIQAEPILVSSDRANDVLLRSLNTQSTKFRRQNSAKQPT